MSLAAAPHTPKASGGASPKGRLGPTTPWHREEGECDAPEPDAHSPTATGKVEKKKVEKKNRRGVDQTPGGMVDAGLRPTSPP